MKKETIFNHNTKSFVKISTEYICHIKIVTNNHVEYKGNIFPTLKEANQFKNYFLNKKLSFKSMEGFISQIHIDMEDEIFEYLKNNDYAGIKKAGIVLEEFKASKK
jgi:hypothetical protein